MIIRNIHITEKKNTASLSADIFFEGAKKQQMYFTVPIKYKKYICVDASPFLASVLLPCMKTKENIIVEESVSQKLLDNTKKIMQLIESWNIGLQRIKISVTKGQGLRFKDKEKLPYPLTLHPLPLKNTGCFFSGGVDSFYTYLKHQKEISHFILVHGFDIPLENTGFFHTVTEQINKVAQEEKKELITVETNIKDIIEPKLVWDFGHGGALAAVGLFLGNGLRKIYISGAVRNDELFPYGSHPDLDALWSTESLEFVHEGTEYNRLGKIMHSISKSPLALKHVRVCTQNIKGTYNCSRCYKCLQTMIELICANKFENAQTFKKPIDLVAVSNMYYNYKLKYNYQGEANVEILQKENREPELQRAIKESLEKSKQFSLKRALAALVANFDQKYNNRRFYRLVFTLDSKQDRNILFKFLSKRGMLK